MFLMFPLSKDCLNGTAGLNKTAARAKMVRLHCTKWPPELKIEKPFNDIS